MEVSFILGVPGLVPPPPAVGVPSVIPSELLTSGSDLGAGPLAKSSWRSIAVVNAWNQWIRGPLVELICVLAPIGVFPESIDLLSPTAVAVVPPAGVSALGTLWTVVILSK